MADPTTPAEIVSRAQDLAPVLRRHAPWAEEHRRLHDEVLDSIAAAGLFRLRVPRRFGGAECSARTLVEVGSALGRADGSAAWATSVSWIPSWMACQFPDSVQEEVFADPDVRICGTLSPSAMAVPTDGGIVVNGKWGFISGAHHSSWQEIIAILAAPDAEPYPVMALVPTAELLIVDDWDTSGLRGSGSVSTVARDLFVPAERVVPLPVVLEGNGLSAANAGSPAYRAPLLPVAAASSVGTLLGLARAAEDVFLARLPHRKITYTGYASQREAPLTHHQVARARTAIDRAEFHALRLADTLDAKGADGTPWKLEERARARGDLGAVAELAKEAVDVLATASGGSSVHRDVPIGRIVRDVHAINLHALIHPDTNAELYGRVLCGLEPDTLYI
jgi:alkylation response protein AidB-like acyl-CoA dehydrogenase